MSKLYPFVGIPHDPSGGTRVRQIPLQLDPGEAIMPLTLQLDPVDKDTGELLTGDTLQLNNITVGPINDTDLWAISFKPLFGTKGTTYYLRVRLYLQSQLDLPQPDMTYRLRCEET